MASLGSCALGLAGTWFVATGLNWDAPERSCVLGILPTLIGSMIAIISVRILIGFGQSVAIASVAAGIIRMMTGLFVSLALFFMANPEGRSFWTAFLISNLLSLIAESIWGIKNNAREAAPAPQTAGVRE